MLSETQDAYGHALRDYVEGRGGYEIVERDDGLMGLSAGPDLYLAPFGQWPAHQQAAMSWAEGRVLDVGCGAGRVALYLQGLGHNVVAIDNSPLALDVCRERGVHDARACPVTRIGRELGRFGAVVMLGNNLGLLGGMARGRWLLRRLKAICTPDACIIAESTDPYATDDPAHLAYHAHNRARGRLGGQLRIRVRYKQYCTPWFDYWLASQQELRELVQGTGWEVRHVFQAERGAGYVALLGRPALQRQKIGP